MDFSCLAEAGCILTRQSLNPADAGISNARPFPVDVIAWFALVCCWAGRLVCSWLAEWLVG